MHPLAFSWPHALVFWLVYLWAFVPESQFIRRGRSGAQRADSPDAGSFQLIVIGQCLALAAAFPLAFFHSSQLPPTYRFVAFWLGLGLLLVGSLLRRHCWHLLGEYFTADVRVRPDQSLVDRGAYRWIRHPAYLAGLMMFTGIGLALGSWASLAVLFGITLAVYLYRMPVEERALLTTFGGAYWVYMRTHKRLIPFLY